VNVPQLKDEEEAVELLDVPTPGRSPDMMDFRAVHVRRDEGTKRKLNGHGHSNEHGPSAEDEDEGRCRFFQDLEVWGSILRTLVIVETLEQR
jgi:hypothetical protein